MDQNVVGLCSARSSATSLVAGQHDAMSRVDGGTPGLADLFGSERESASVRMDFDCAL